MVEVEEQPFWGSEHWLRRQVVSYLFDLGLVPVARDFEYRYQYNILFVRAELLAGPNKICNELACFASRADRRPQNQQGGRSLAPTAKAVTWKGKARKRIGAAGRSARQILGLARPD